MISLPNGSIVSIASSYVAAANITALSNASPAVATATNTLVAGDIVEITSGWSRLNQKPVRVLAPSGTSFSLEAYDTTSVITYPAGSGTGSFRKVVGFTQLQQILTSNSNGGEMQFLNYQLLESDSEKRLPTVKSAAGLTFSIADDPTLAGYILAAAANDDRLPRVIKIALSNGGVLLYNCYVTLDKTPSLTVNQIMACQVTLSLLAEPVRY